MGVPNLHRSDKCGEAEIVNKLSVKVIVVYENDWMRCNFQKHTRRMTWALIKPLYFVCNNNIGTLLRSPDDDGESRELISRIRVFFFFLTFTFFFFVTSR